MSRFWSLKVPTTENLLFSSTANNGPSGYYPRPVINELVYLNDGAVQSVNILERTEQS